MGEFDGVKGCFLAR